MSTITVPRSLTDNTNPTEAQFDTMRTYLLNFFNSNNLDESNVAAASMVWTSLTGALDDATLKFTSSHATFGYISASDYLKVINTQGSIVWGTRVGAALTDRMELRSTDGAIILGGYPTINSDVGAQTVNLMWLMSRYRKPRLEYTSADIVTAESNSTTSGQTIIMMRDKLTILYDTSCSLAADANGYAAGHTGTAVSGLLVADTRTANRWYYVYAVEVQYGDQALDIYSILVARELSPETANIATLNTDFGTGKWVYMGVIRNGYNDGTNTNVIVKFKYDAAGVVRFTEGTVDNEGIGLTLASTTGSTDLEYTIVIGNAAAATVPGVATRCIFSGHRSLDGMEMHYRDAATDENHHIASGCYHPGTALTMQTCVHMEVPLLEDYKIVIVVGATSSDSRITLVGFSDHYC